MRWSGCAICRLKIWDLPRWIIIARCAPGMPEVIFAESKTPAQVAAIFARMAKAGGNVLATRASREVYEAVLRRRNRAPSITRRRARSR